MDTHLNMGPRIKEIPLCPLHSEYDMAALVRVYFQARGCGNLV